MRDQYMTAELAYCSDLHLLEMLLFYAIPRVDTNDIARLLLNKFKNINGVIEADKKDFISVPGVGENTWLLIQSIRKLSDESVLGRKDVVNLSDKKVLFDFFYSLSYSAVNEYMDVVFLNNSMDVISHYRYKCSDEEPFNPSKVFDRDFNICEKFCVCAHTKPNSDPVPDRNDLKIAYEIASLLSQQSIELKDFLIIGRGEVRSAINCRIADQ